jgi:hypothetical protein
MNRKAGFYIECARVQVLAKPLVVKIEKTLRACTIILKLMFPINTKISFYLLIYLLIFDVVSQYVVKLSLNS